MNPFGTLHGITSTPEAKAPEPEHAPHDCSAPQGQPVPVEPSQDATLAESYSLGHKGSQAARRKRSPYFVR